MRKFIIKKYARQKSSICFFESTNLQPQRTHGRKLRHLGATDAKPHNLCDRNKARICEIEIRQSRLEIIVLERQDSINI